MNVYYLNSKNKKIDFLSWPYMLQTADLFDYAWNYESSVNKRMGGKIIGFKRGIMERTIKLSIFAETKEEYHASINELHDVFEYDVLKKQQGTLYVGEYFICCYIIESNKEEWEESFDSMELTLKLILEDPFWCKENPFSFIGTVSILFSEYVMNGHTDALFHSRGEDGKVTFSVVTANGSKNHTISSLPLCHINDYYDYISKREGVWGVTKNIEIELFRPSDFLKIGEGNYITYCKELGKESNGILSCNQLVAGMNEISSEELNDIATRNGYEIVCENAQDSIAIVEIYGTEGGITSFHLMSIRGTDKNAVTNTYEYLSQYTYENLSHYSFADLEAGIDRCSILIEFTGALYLDDKIFLDIDGIWKLKQSNVIAELSNDLQGKLSNFRTFKGTTMIYTDSEQLPIINATFKSEAYYNNVRDDGSCLLFPSQEFVHIDGTKLYVRMLKNASYENLKILYVLKESYFTPLSTADQQTMESIEKISNIKNIIYGDFGNEEPNSLGMYPHGYPRGYAANEVDEIINNETLAASNFKMILYGPCSDPTILIAGHTYKVFATLERGEYIIIDSRNKTVYQYFEDSTSLSLFNQRYKEESLFDKIPAGNLTISWNREFGFDLILFDERSEPKWR
ncbi:hypothetical protein [Anaerosacchariphilus polymeriproducens]|uniref:Phage tail protein n=1 Tax=Anaerosacchariphilus polymeriproducens TaxID=1812858 RepID=A0A371ARL4_9FIRM|nr:hypothetical protein [Anaerosacchariphilus polymeriproducens]RDU22213.1 hypothetical protein DWV06_16950 [Anaerosacchariphilus polymeriproducens]